MNPKFPRRGSLLTLALVVVAGVIFGLIAGLLGIVIIQGLLA